MFTEASFVFLLYFSAFKAAASTSDIQSTLDELETKVFELQGELNMQATDEFEEFQDYRLKSLNADISKVKNEFQTELQKMSSKISEMKSTIQNAINQQQRTMSILTFRIDKLMKSTNEEKECFKHDDNAASCIHKPFCAFCAKEDFASSRCDIPDNLISNGCPQSAFININESLEINVGANDRQSAYTVPLCPGTKRNITINFQTSNHPVDIYILVDGSNAGRLFRYHEQYFTPLVEVLKNISSDYTLGLGISTGKPIFPFGSHGSFSFKNAVRLTKEIKQLTDYVQFKAHLDEVAYLSSSSQLEGMFQTAACKEQIGWRNNTRKVLLTIFGYNYDVERDGARGGITKLFDGFCALNATGFYANELTQDYPSEDQIIQVIKKENINAVFALPFFYFYNLYKRLVDRLDPPAYHYYCNYEFNNMSTGFTKVMKEMNSVIELEQSKLSDDVRVTLYSSCNGEEEQMTSKCENIVSGTSKFKVEFEMLRCPALDSNRKQMITINPKGLPISAQFQMHLNCNCTF